MEEKKCKVSLKQLVEDRKEEMRSILPGFMSKVTDGKNTVIVESPGVLERSTFKVNEVE